MSSKGKLFAKAAGVAFLVALLLVFLYFVSYGARSFLSHENLPLVVFSIGFLAQIILIGREKFFSRVSLLVLFLCLFFGLFPYKHENLSEYNLAFHFFVSVLLFGLLESVVLRDRILVKLDEFKLLLFSMMFSYVLYVFFGFGAFFLVSLVPLLVTLFFCFTAFTPGSRTKLLLYVWFVLVWIGLCFALLQKFFVGAVLARMLPFLNFTLVDFSPVEYFFFGMSSFLLISMVFYLFLLVPIQGKHESFKQALKRSREMARALVSSFDDSNASRLAALLAFLFFGGFFAVNSALGFLEPVALIAFFLSTNGLIDYLPYKSRDGKPRSISDF